jgi:hypothetical protein
MSVDVVKQTLALVKQAQGQPSDAIAKSINLATGLVAFDLQAPAKNLYPVNTPIRNSLPRIGGGTGTATNWRQVSAITGSGYDGSPWVPEGQRAGRMSYTTANKAATYVTIGEEDQITYEARKRGAGLRGRAGRDGDAPPAEDDAEGGERHHRRQRLARPRHHADADLSRRRLRRHPAGADLRRRLHRAHLRGLAQLEPAGGVPPRRW